METILVDFGFLFLSILNESNYFLADCGDACCMLEIMAVCD